MVGTHPVKHSFSIGRNIHSYTLVFKRSCHTQFHTRFEMVGTHHAKHSFSNGWDTPGYPLVFKWSRHIWLHTRFRKVGTAGYTLFFIRSSYFRLVTLLFSKCRHTPSYALVFWWSGPIRLYTRFQMVRTHNIRNSFKMVVTHSAICSFSNGQDTPGYTIVFKSSNYTLVFK